MKTHQDYYVMKNYLNCPVVDDQIDPDFRKAINILSNDPVLEVPIRDKGITSGGIGLCYWNANLCAQTWGGEVIYGWIVEAPGFCLSGYCLWGHACWLTPEGKLVDPTGDPHRGQTRWFLPSSEKLVLNSKRTEQMSDFFYPGSSGDWMNMLGVRSMRHSSVLDEISKPRSFYKGKAEVPFVFDKLFFLDAFPKELAESFFLSIEDIRALNGMDKEMYDFHMDMGELIHSCFISEVDDQTPKKIISDPSLSFSYMIGRSLQAKKPILEKFHGFNPVAFRYWDMVWGSSEISNPSLDGVSTFTGKTIREIPPLASLVEEHELPISKSKLKKVKGIAERRNLSPKEVVMLSNPYLFPHPYLVKKTGSTRRIARV